MQKTLEREPTTPTPLAEEHVAIEDQLFSSACDAKRVPDGLHWGRKIDREDRPVSDEDFQSWVETTLWYLAAP